MLLFFVTLGVFAGCASEMKRGQRELDRGDFASAVQHFERAVNDQKPKELVVSARQLAWTYRENGQPLENKKLNEAVVKLADALERAARWSFDAATQTHARARQAEAKAALEKTLSYIPGYPGARELLNKVVQAQSQASALHAQAQQQARSSQWDQAVETLNTALKTDGTLPGGQATLDRIKQEAYQWYCALAKQALERDAREEVKQQVANARRFADGPEARQTLETVDTRNRADRSVAAAGKEFEAGKFEKALTHFLEAEALYPTMPGLAARIVTTKERICDGYLAQGKKELAAYHFFEALRQFTRSQTLLPDYGRVEGYLAVVSERIAEQHLSQARQFQQRGLHGNAVLHQVLCLNYQPQNVTVARELEESMRAIRQEVQYTIGFLGFEAKASDRSIADRAEARGLQHLNRIKPENVQVRDMLSLRPGVEAQQRPLENLIGGDGRLGQGVDALIMGKVLENSVRITTQTTYGQSEYQYGMKAVPNPDYDQAMHRYNQANQNLLRAQQNLQSAEQMLETARALNRQDSNTVNQIALATQTQLTNMARNKVQQCQREVTDAQNAVTTTPRLKNVPDMRQHRYPILTKTKAATVTFSIKMVDTATGSVLFTDRFEGQFAQSDRTVEEDLAHNVSADPWEVPDDAVMSTEALEALTGKLHASIELATQKHGHRFIVLMRQAEAKKQTEQVVENVIKYLFAYPIDPEDTERLMRGLEPVIAKQADFVNLPQRLRQYCGIMRGQGRLPLVLVFQNNRLLIQKAEGVELGVSLPCELTAIEGKPVQDTRDVAAVLRPYGPGDEVAVVLSSNGRKQTKNLRLIPDE
jgi:tetratricopeptide (TPR) repeat protein